MSERDVRFLMRDATRAKNPPPKLMKLVHTSDARQQNPMVTEWLGPAKTKSNWLRFGRWKP